MFAQRKVGSGAGNRIFVRLTMRRSYVIPEHGLLRRASDFARGVAGPETVWLPDAAFEELKAFVLHYQADPVLSCGWLKGREVIRARNYVGVLETPGGTRLEILPKLPNARTALLTMLRHLRGQPFRQLPGSREGRADLPLWEVFVSAFLHVLTDAIRPGVQTAYATQERDEPYLRGRLQLARQLRRGPGSVGRLAVVMDQRVADVPPNRLLKAALQYVEPRTAQVDNQRLIRQLQAVLADVPPSQRPDEDVRAARLAGRLFARYEPALAWAELLLTGRTPDPLAPAARPWLNLALLFPMERVFEAYVAAGFRRYGEGTVSVQEASRHLITEPGGGQTLRLRPDLVRRQPGRVTVLDTKWKWLDPGKATGTYGLDPGDLYQLYAYGRKYEADELVLIYPAHEGFREPLPRLQYEPTLGLRVVPFDLSRPLAEEVRKILLL